MGRRRASIDWCPASPPCTHTHIDSPFLPCRATLFFQPSSTFFLPRFPIFQPRVIPFLLFLFARPSYFSFGREPRFSALHLSPTSVFAWNRRFYASCTPPVSVCLSLPRTRFVSKRRSSPIHRRRTTNFFAHLLRVPSIPVYSEFLLQTVRHIVSFELFLPRTFASLILSLFSLCSPPLFPFVHALNRLFAL